MTAGGWNPRFIAYARAQGRSPGRQLQEDERRWPGGRMAGFMLWVQAKWAEYRALRRAQGEPLGEALDDRDHRAFDAWLAGGGEYGGVDLEANFRRNSEWMD